MGRDSYSNATSYNGKSAVAAMISQTPGSNSLQTMEGGAGHPGKPQEDLPLRGGFRHGL